MTEDKTKVKDLATELGVPTKNLLQALRELDLTAAQTIHVGDSREDIEGAVGAGIRPVWIDRQRKDRWRAQPETDVTRISSLCELLDLLD